MGAKILSVDSPYQEMSRRSQSPPFDQDLPSDPALSVRSHPAMGTAFDVYLHDVAAPDLQACFQTIFEEIDRIETTFSRFLPGSEISRINRLASQGPVVTDPEVFGLLAFCVAMSEKSQGAFDVTVGPRTRAWKAAQSRDASNERVSSLENQQTRAEAVGWRHLHLDAQWRTVEFLKPGMELDFGAVAKGYAVDCALRSLRPLGVECLIDAGSSSIGATGEFFNSHWQVEIADPTPDSLTLPALRLEGRALSTSGIKEQHRIEDGRIVSHLIDPDPARAEFHPQRTILQTTVLCADSTMAEALSTALFVLGPERGAGVLELYPGSSALWICREGGSTSVAAVRWPSGSGIFSTEEEHHGAA